MIEYHEAKGGGFLISWGTCVVKAVMREHSHYGLFLNDRFIEDMSHAPHEPYGEFMDTLRVRAVMHLTAAYEQNIANRRIAREAIEALGDCRKTLDRFNELLEHTEISDDKSLRIFRDVVSMLDQAVATMDSIE